NGMAGLGRRLRDSSGGRSILIWRYGVIGGCGGSGRLELGGSVEGAFVSGTWPPARIANIFRFRTPRAATIIPVPSSPMPAAKVVGLTPARWRLKWTTCRTLSYDVP